VVGQLKKESGSYVPGLKFMAVCILLASVLAMLLKTPKKSSAAG
jgi:hypothetical protein